MSKKAEAEIERARLAATVEAARCAKESLQQWPTVSELMVAARSVNGSAPLPTDPQGRQRLLDQATDFWQDARAYLDARKRAAQWEAEEAKRLAEETHWRSQLDLSTALFYLANPDDPFAEAAIQKIIADSGMGAMKFAAFINKITGSGRTVDNMARVRKWLEGRAIALSASPARRARLKCRYGRCRHMAKNHARSGRHLHRSGP